VVSSAVFDQCQFPILAEPYNQALHEAVAFILLRFTPLGIIASGSILRGNPDPASDLDLYVIHPQPYRQRIQKFFNGVPAEIFVNPPEQVRRYLIEEQAEYTPITAHMLTTGFPILELDPVIAELRQLALLSLAEPPMLSPEKLVFMRYMAANWLEDAADLARRDEATANLFLSQAVFEIVRVHLIASGKYLPRNKELISQTDALNPELGTLLRQFYLISDCASRLGLAYQIADRTVHIHGFFEWESSPEEVGGK
jgi:predicted nucleotidyltransferase